MTVPAFSSRNGDLLLSPNVDARSRTRRVRRGYTLLELLLVLSILLIVSAAASPAVVGLMADYRLKEATEKIRISLAASRIHCIDLSSTYQFRFELGGRRYLAIPTDAEVYNSAIQNSSAASVPSAVTNGVPNRRIEIGELPEGCTFQAALAVGSATGMAMPMTTAPVQAASTDLAWAAAVARVPVAATLGAVAWSPPIVFHPDGTATDTALNIVDKGGRGFRISLRELTGEILVQRMVQGT
jgi:prepilin-type N-terminal cleavage/methylation domain-containing protein